MTDCRRSLVLKTHRHQYGYNKGAFPSVRVRLEEGYIVTWLVDGPDMGIHNKVDAAVWSALPGCTT